MKQSFGVAFLGIILSSIPTAAAWWMVSTGDLGFGGALIALVLAAAGFALLVVSLVDSVFRGWNALADEKQARERETVGVGNQAS